MSTDPNPTGQQPLPGLLQHHDEEEFLDALELLISNKRARTADELVRYAERANEPGAAAFLRNLAAEGLPLDLVFDALSVHVRIVAFKRNNQLLHTCRDRQIGLVLPLPPHVLEVFTALPKITFLVPDGHHLPPNLRRTEADVKSGSRAARNAAAQMEVLVFEACRDDDLYRVDAAVSDVVDLRIIPPGTQLIVNLRPHGNPEDVPLTVTTHSLNIL